MSQKTEELDPGAGSPEPRKRAPEIWVLVISIALSAALGVVSTRSYLALHNTLENNGRWVSTKTTLERGLLGAYSFITERQTLAGGALQLNAWHGNNEVTSVDGTLEPVRIEFDLRLGKLAYTGVFFDRRPGEAYEGVLLSTVRRFRNRVFEASPTGEFLAARPLAARLVAEDRWQRVRLELSRGSVEVFVDDVTLGRFDRPEGPRGGAIGFRCGVRDASIDNVVVVDGDGRRWIDSFDAPADSGRVTLGVVSLLLAANLGLFVLLRRATRAEGLNLAFSLLMVNATLLVVTALIFFLVVMRADRYLFADDRLAEQEAYFRKGAADVVMDEIVLRHAPSSNQEQEEGAAEPAAEREDNNYRILFVGGSQTWGAGAAREDEVFVRVLEGLLDDVARRTSLESGRPPVRFETVNAGFSAHKAADLVPLVTDLLALLEPRMVVINVSSNDKGNSHFARPLARLVDLSVESGAQVLLVQEANSPETWRKGLGVRHQEMAALAEARDLPIVDMHHHLASRRWTGFLWWDHVHLTTFGQRLLAEKLRDEILPLVPLGQENRRPEPAGVPSS